MTNFFIPQFQQVVELFKGARKVLIASHEHPDPDAVSSVLAFHYVLKKQALASLPYLPDLPSKSLSYLPGFFDIRTDVNSFEPDILLCLDYGDFRRLRLPQHILAKSSPEIITIDHHLANDQAAGVKILAPEFSSTSEIIYHWLKYADIEIDKEIAACLLTGIISDSGGFRHVSTSSNTLNIVSELFSRGVSLNKITRQALAFNKPLNFSKAWGQVLSRTKLDRRTNLAYSWIDAGDFEKFGADLISFDGIVNLISAASSANLGLFLIEYEKGKIKGSLRSEPHGGINVMELAKSLGGGGHAYAAGFQQEGTIEEVLKKVLNLVE